MNEKNLEFGNKETKLGKVDAFMAAMAASGLVCIVPLFLYAETGWSPLLWFMGAAVVSIIALVATGKIK